MARDREPQEEPGRRRVSARMIGVAVLGVVLVWFALANSARVQVSFLVVDREVRLVVALAVAAVLGLAVGYLAGRGHGRAD